MAATLQSTSSSRRSLAAGLLTGVCLLSAVVMSRRAAGAASSLPSVWAACLIAAAVMAVGVLSIALFSRRATVLGMPERLLVGGLSLLPGLVLGLALIPESSGAGLAALIGVFATLLGASVGLRESVAGGVQHSLVTTPGVPDSALVCDSNEIVTSPTSSWVAAVEPPATPELGAHFARPQPRENVVVTHHSDTGIANESPPHPSTDPEVVQWQARAVRDGHETLEGGMRVRFAAGVKQVALHLPFAPAFESLPTFDAEPLDDAEIEIVVTSLHAYGVRLEVRSKSRCEHDRLIEIGYSAVPSCEQSAAA